jgi:hypothetical protein
MDPFTVVVFIILGMIAICIFYYVLLPLIKVVFDLVVLVLYVVGHAVCGLFWLIRQAAHGVAWCLATVARKVHSHNRCEESGQSSAEGEANSSESSGWQDEGSWTDDAGGYGYQDAEIDGDNLLVESYELLGLSASATPREVNRQFHIRAFQDHPDRGGDDLTMTRLLKARDTVLRSLEEPSEEVGDVEV